MKTIYLDHQASTPLDPDVLQAMMPWLSRPANPHASENEEGRQARNAVERARAQIAASMGAEPSGVIFTAGATEAANIVLRSFGLPGARILSSAIEHPCVADTLETLAARGLALETIPVEHDGLVDTEVFHDRLHDGVALVSCMAVNNEVGTIQPLMELAAACRAAEVPLHADAAQALGRVRLRLGSHFDYATISGHKIYGPQGIGAIVAAPQALRRLRPIATGGGQETGIRPGTLPVAACVGFGEACEIAMRRLDQDARHMEEVREAFLATLMQEAPGALINGSLETRVPHNLSIGFRGIDAQELLACVPHLALSTGSACASGAIGTSRVLKAMGVDDEVADGTVRVGFGRGTGIDDAASAGRDLGAAAHRLVGRRRKR